MGSFFAFGGPIGLFLGLEFGLKIIFGSTHIVEQLSFSIIPSILTLGFELIFGSFLTFWGPNVLFLEQVLDSNTDLGPNGLFLGSE